MKISTLKCNNCGADLKITTPEVKYFSCSFCGSSLTIKKSGNVIFTEVLDEIKDNTETLIEHSEAILIEKEIARLDREWQLKREKYMIHSESGSSVPDSGTIIASVIGGILAIGFGIFWLTSMPKDAPDFFTFLGIGAIVLGIISTIYSVGNTESYQDAEKEYLEQRRILLNKLEETKK